MATNSEKLYKQYASEIKEINEETRTMVVRISTATPDRSNDVVIPQGMDSSNYMGKNAVVAAFHRYDKPAIGKTIELTTSEDGVIAKIEWTPEGVNPEADMLYKLYQLGYMSAWSIGFIGKKWSDLENYGRQFDEWELLEFSAVLVPANPEALTLLRDAGLSEDIATKGLEVEKEETLLEKLTKLVELVEAKNKTQETKLEAAEEKDGRVLSKKNRGLIEDALKSLDGVAVAFKALLEATEPEKTQESEEENIDLQTLKEIRDAMRGQDKSVGLFLRQLNKAIKNNQ